MYLIDQHTHRHMYLDAPVYIWGVQVYMCILQERGALPVDTPSKLSIYS